jgi:xylulokinase
MPLVAGVDCSTQSTKVLIVDSDGGSVVAAGKSEHQVTGTGGARETHPQVWWDALAAALGQTGRASDVRAIAVGGQQHGLVVLDQAGRPLRPAMLWNDIRAAPNARRLIEEFGGEEQWAERIGLVPVASYTVCKWAWLRKHEPETAAGARAIRLPHDYLNDRLAGRGASDRGDASGTGWWSTRSEDYEADVINLPSVQLQRELLPEVLGPSETVGPTTGSAGAELSLASGTKVAPGTGDNMAAALGLGLQPGEPVISLGTSGTVYMTSPIRAADPTGTVSGFADATGRFLPLAATLNCTLAVDRVASWLGVDRDDAASHSEVVVFPYLDGERTPNLPEAAGTILGLRHNTSKEEILLATYRGAVLGLIDALDRVIEHSSGLAPDAPLILIGGGARSPTWRRVVGELSGRQLQVPEAEELVALGAAAQATAALTGETADEVARRWDTRRGLVIDPLDRDTEAIERIRSARDQISF